MVRHGSTGRFNLCNFLIDHWMYVLPLFFYSVWNVILILIVQGAIGGMKLIEIKSPAEMGLPVLNQESGYGACIIKGGLPHDRLLTPSPPRIQKRTTSPAAVRWTPSPAGSFSSSFSSSSAASVALPSSSSSSASSSSSGTMVVPPPPPPPTPAPTVPPTGTYDTVMQYRMSAEANLLPGAWSTNVKNQTLPEFSVKIRYYLPSNETSSSFQYEECPEFISQCYSGNGALGRYSEILYWQTADYQGSKKTAGYQWIQKNSDGSSGYRNPITTQVRGLMIALNVFRFTSFPFLCMLCICGLLSGYIGVIIFTLILSKLLERCMSKEQAEKGAWSFVVGFLVFNVTIGHFIEQWGSLVAILVLSDQLYDQPACDLQTAPGPLAEDVKWGTFIEPGPLYLFLIVICVLYAIGGSVLFGMAMLVKPWKKKTTVNSSSSPSGKLGVSKPTPTAVSPAPVVKPPGKTPKPNNIAFSESGIPEEELLAMGDRPKPQPEVPDEELLAYQPPPGVAGKSSAPIPDEELLGYSQSNNDGKSSAPLPLGAPPPYSSPAGSKLAAPVPDLPPPTYSTYKYHQEDQTGESGATVASTTVDFGTAPPEDSDVFLLGKKPSTPQVPPPAAAARKRSSYRDRLETFVKHYCPEKILIDSTWVDTQLSNYAGQETLMFERLVQKFGPEPPAPASAEEKLGRGDTDDFL